MSEGTLLLVGAGLLQIPAIHVAKSMGLRVVATDRDPQPLAFRLVDESITLDTKDVGGHVELGASAGDGRRSGRRVHRGCRRRSDRRPRRPGCWSPWL